MRGVGPPLMPSGYNANYHIVQSAGHVMILSEMIHDARIIPLDDPSAPPAGVRQWIGVSRGHWDGDALVVETTNFNGKNPFQGSGDRMTVTERFTRVSDDVIEYRFTVDDPGTWDRPWTAENLMQRTRGPLFESRATRATTGSTTRSSAPVLKSSEPPRRPTSRGTGDMAMRTRLPTMTLADDSPY